MSGKSGEDTRTFGKPYIVGILASKESLSNSKSFILGSIKTRSRIALETYGVWFPVPLKMHNRNYQYQC